MAIGEDQVYFSMGNAQRFDCVFDRRAAFKFVTEADMLALGREKIVQFGVETKPSYGQLVLLRMLP